MLRQNGTEKKMEKGKNSTIYGKRELIDNSGERSQSEANPPFWMRIGFKWREGLVRIMEKNTIFKVGSEWAGGS